MEPILDESTLEPCVVRSAPARIEALALTLTELDALGLARVLRSVRSVRTAPDLDLGNGRGLRSWCFDPATPRDAGRLVAARLGKQPYIDGEGGLFSSAEGSRAVEATVCGRQVVGLGLAAMTDGIVVSLTSQRRAAGGSIKVIVAYLYEDEQCEECVEVLTFAAPQEVVAARQTIIQRIDRDVPNGAAIVTRLPELFPRLCLGDLARKQIEALTGKGDGFRQLVRHLRALDESASTWKGGAYEPKGILFSVESSATLNHGIYGPMRDFPTPAGFAIERWSLHPKLGGGTRMYFRANRAEGRPVILIGYFGNHLPTATSH